MYRIRIRDIERRWYTQDTFLDREEAIEEYNNARTPKMLIGPKGIEHKQYTDNGFVYTGKGR